MKKNKLKYTLAITFISIMTIGHLCSCSAKKTTKVETLRIMSFNIRYNNAKDNENAWDYRREACINMFKDIKPDIFGIQEGLIEQVNYIDSLLPDYSWFGVGRDSLMKYNEYSAIFYKTNEFKLLEQHTIWLSETPEQCSKGWDARYPRVATYGLFKAKKFNRNIVVINTHFDHKGELARENSAKLVAELALKLTQDTLPIFIIGDFNATYTNNVLTPIVTQFDCAQKQALITDDFGSVNDWGNAPEDKVIDHIFYKNATPTNYETILQNYGVKYISDHFPIITDFEL